MARPSAADQGLAPSSRGQAIALTAALVLIPMAGCLGTAPGSDTGLEDEPILPGGYTETLNRSWGLGAFEDGSEWVLLDARVREPTTVVGRLTGTFPTQPGVEEGQRHRDIRDVCAGVGVFRNLMALLHRSRQTGATARVGGTQVEAVEGGVGGQGWSGGLTNSREVRAGEGIPLVAFLDDARSWQTRDAAFHATFETADDVRLHTRVAAQGETICGSRLADFDRGTYGRALGVSYVDGLVEPFTIEDRGIGFIFVDAGAGDYTIRLRGPDGVAWEADRELGAETNQTTLPVNISSGDWRLEIPTARTLGDLSIGFVILDLPDRVARMLAPDQGQT